MGANRFFLLLLHSFGFHVRMYFCVKSFWVARVAAGFLVKIEKQI